MVPLDEHLCYLDHLSQDVVRHSRYVCFLCKTDIYDRRYRRAITKSLNSIQGKITKTERLLSMFIEAGAIYCLSGVSSGVGKTSVEA